MTKIIIPQTTKGNTCKKKVNKIKHLENNTKHIKAVTKAEKKSEKSMGNHRQKKTTKTQIYKYKKCEK